MKPRWSVHSLISVRVRTLKRTLVVLGVLIVIGNADADKPMPIEDIERMQQIGRGLDAIKEIKTLVDQISHERRFECLKAFGHERFCACVFDEMPIAWSFAQYIAITTKSKEENDYETLDDDYKKAYDLVRPIRDRCVAKLHF